MSHTLPGNADRNNGRPH